MATSLPALPDIEAVARRLQLAVSASELHGSLCGWLAGGGDNGPGWLPKVMSDDALPAQAADGGLERLRTASVAQFEDGDFGFELLLPDDGEALPARMTALFDWCRGFVGAFGLAVGERPELSEEGKEALDDLVRLAAAAPEQGEAEEDEAALAEIEEFVRVAALLLYGDRVLGKRHRSRLN